MKALHQNMLSGAILNTSIFTFSNISAIFNVFPICEGKSPLYTVNQRHKNLKLSGQRLFTRKNFPDEARGPILPRHVKKTRYRYRDI